MLTGTFEHNLDDKTRLTLPSKLRSKMGTSVYVTKGFEDCLEVRSSENFQKWYESEISSHTSTKSDTRMIMRHLLANTSEIEVDTAGRIKIPSNLLELANITKEVTILGLGDKVELWDSKSHSEYVEKTKDLIIDAANNLGGA